MRRFLSILAALLVLMAALPFVVLAVLQTGPAREALARSLGAALSIPGRSVTVEDPALGWDGRLRVAALSVADESGPWLTISDFVADWQPSALLTGRLSFESAIINRVELARPPEGLGTPPPETPAPTDADEAEATGLPLAVDIPQIRVRDIVLAEPVAGASMRLTARGMLRMRPDPAMIETALHVERDDDIAGRFDASIGFVQDAPFLRIDLRASEPAGGLIARLLRIEALPAVDMEMSGEGPLDAWHGRLSVALDDRETVSGRVDLTRAGAQRQLALELEGALADILPPGLRDIFAGPMRLTAAADLSTDYAPLGGKIDMASDAFTLAGEGAVDEQSGRLVGALEGRLLRRATLGEGESRIEADAFRISARADGSLAEANWTAEIDGQGLTTPQARLSSLAIEAGGENADLRADSRDIPIALDARAQLAALSDPRLEPLSGAVTLAGRARVEPGNAVAIEALKVTTPALSADLSGRYATRDTRLTGEAEVLDLAALSALAGRSLSGNGRLTFELSGDPLTRIGALEFAAQADELAAADPQLDALLGGRASLQGQLARGEDGVIQISDVRFATAAMEASVSGRSGGDSIAAETRVAISDLALLDARVAGGITMSAEISGPLAAPELEARIESERLVMRGEPLTDLVVVTSATVPRARPSGTIEIAARYRDQPLTGSAGFVTAEDGARQLNDIRLAAANARVAGRLAIDSDGTPSGVLDLAAPDLSEIAPLLLQDLAGALEARVEIAEREGKNTAVLSAQVEDLVRDDLQVGSADLRATIVDPLGAPRIDGELSARAIQQGGVTVTRMSAEASNDGTTTKFSGEAALDDGDVSLAGSLVPDGNGFAITLDRAGGEWRDIETRLTEPARIAVVGGAAEISNVTLALGNGTASLAGTAGEKFDIDARFDRVPVALANTVAPGLGLAGALSGTAKLTGTVADPAATWTLTWNDARAAQTTAYALPSATVRSEGRYSGGRITHTTVASLGGGTITAKGSVAPQAQPAALDMSVSGTIPLALAQRRLLEAGLRLDGQANLDMTIGGTVASPNFGGSLSASGLTAVGLETGIVVKNLAIEAAFSPQRLELKQLSGEVGGGRLSGSGTVALTDGMASDLTLKIDDATYQDGRVVNARFDADLKLSGPLAGAPTLSGTILLKQTDITIPETVGSKISALAVKHVNAPADVRQQAARLDKKDGGGGTSGNIGLDLTVNAPSRMFVRGRGLQAELSGTVRIRGTTGSPVTSGAFTLRRGTLTILSRLLTFTRGTITFLGSFDPRLDFAATTSTSDAEVTVLVTGNASDPEIGFASSPDLPQDEILARLLFNQSLANLSATQIAQLASAVATLGGADPLERLRKSLGVDSINITTDENNNAAVNLGKNIGDKLRLGVQQGTQQGSGRVTVDIDINKTLRARGEVGEDGNSKAGIFFEKEF